MRRHLGLAAALCLLPIAADARVSSYIFVRGHTHMMMKNVKLERGLSIRDSTGDNFLWFRADGKTYLVRDVETLDEIDRLFSGSLALDPEYESLRQRRKPVDDREEQLDREIDRIEERIDEISDDENETVSKRDERSRLEGRMHELEHELRDVEQRARSFDEAEQELDRKQEEMEREAERAMEPVLERAIRRGLAKSF